MTGAAQLLGGPQVTPAQGAGKDQQRLKSEQGAADFGALLAAVEQIAELQAEGVIELDLNGQPVVKPDVEPPAELQALIAGLSAAEPEVLEAKAGAQTFVPRALGPRGRDVGFKPLDLARPQVVPLTPPTDVPTQVSAPIASNQPTSPWLSQATPQQQQVLEQIQAIARQAPSAGELAAKVPEAPAPKIESTVAPAPRLEAAIQQHLSQETSNPVVRQVAQNVQTLVRGDVERMRFDLYPEELGRVSVQMQKVAGTTKIMIVTETPQAFEALQRGAGGLQQSLSQAGFDPDEMTFEQHSERREQESAEERRERDDRRPSYNEAEDEKRVALIRPAQTEDRGLFL